VTSTAVAGDAAVGIRRAARLPAVLGYLVSTRLALFIVAAAAVRLLPHAIVPIAPGVRALPSTLRPWVYWDAGWYLSIVERGYWFDPSGPSNVAFFPLYPLLTKLVALATRNPAVAALVVANGAAAATVVLVWRWAALELGEQVADESARWMLVYPFAFFLHAAYGESLYLLLAAGTLFAARRGHWAAAGTLAGLAAATRPAGVLLLPALAWALCTETRAGRGRVRNWGALALAGAGALAYPAYLHFAFGDALAFWQAHVVGWDVPPGGDVRRFFRELRSLASQRFPVQGYTQLLTASRLLLPPAFLALTVRVFRRLGPAAGVYTALAVAVGTLWGLESVGRELLAAAPVFVVSGTLGVGRHAEGLRALALAIQLVFLIAFVTGRFVG
jgi:hypothetical protein